MHHISYIHSSVERHLCSGQLLSIINRAAMNKVKHVSLLYAGESYDYMSRTGSPSSNAGEYWRLACRMQIEPFVSPCTKLKVKWTKKFPHKTRVNESNGKKTGEEG